MSYFLLIAVYGVTWFIALGLHRADQTLDALFVLLSVLFLLDFWKNFYHLGTIK